MPGSLSFPPRSAPFPRRAAVAVAAAVSLAWSLGLATPSPSVAREPIEIAMEDARSYVGQYVQVCGTVTTSAYMAASGRQPTFLNFGEPYPNHSFTVVIWGANRHKFPKAPVQLFDGQPVCVTGTVATYKGRPQIVVEAPEQIELMEGDEASGNSAGLSEIEAVFVKALLEAYGEGVNYGTSEWDQETVEALSRFQDETGVQATGDPDPETLRALAKRVLDLTDEEQERIIRLLLFRMASRRD